MGMLAEVDHVVGAAPYIGNHPNRQSNNVRRYIVSNGWVFHGWIGFSRWFKKEFGVYPPREMLVELSRMSKDEQGRA